MYMIYLHCLGTHHGLALWEIPSEAIDETSVQAGKVETTNVASGQADLRKCSNKALDNGRTLRAGFARIARLQTASHQMCVSHKITTPHFATR